MQHEHAVVCELHVHCCVLVVFSQGASGRSVCLVLQGDALCWLRAGRVGVVVFRHSILTQSNHVEYGHMHVTSRLVSRVVGLFPCPACLCCVLVLGVEA